MRFVEIANDPSTAALLDMLQHLSGSRTAQEAFEAFMRRYWKYRPVDHFLGVLPDGSGEGRYRIIFHVDVAEAAAGKALPRRNPDPAFLDALAVHEGGLIARLISEPRPIVVEDLDLRDDPALGGWGGGMRTCVALPVFGGHAIVEWLVAFSGRVDTIALRDAQQALLTANLMGMANAELSLLEEVRRLNRTLSRQLEDVAKLQQSLLPARIPDIPGLVIATSYLTCDQAGGDYYDFFELPDGRWAILIADVSGHGAAAATIMAMMHAILHCFPGPNCCADKILHYANERLLKAGIEGNFVTAFLALYDPSTGEVNYASSGHHPPRLKSGSTGGVVALDAVNSLPLGIQEPYEIESGTVGLRPGDSLVLYTDGITEEFNGRREMFGVERLDSALHSCSGEPDCIIDSVHRALYEHTGARTRADDQTLVAVRYQGLNGQRSAL